MTLQRIMLAESSEPYGYFIKPVKPDPLDFMYMYPDHSPNLELVRHWQSKGIAAVSSCC